MVVSLLLIPFIAASILSRPDSASWCDTAPASGWEQELKDNRRSPTDHIDEMASNMIPRRARRGLAIAAVCFTLSSSAFAQQRPLVTQDPETIGAGRILIEGG